MVLSGIYNGSVASQRLRVAHVAPYDPAGGNGVARAVLNWARVLPDFDIDVEIWDFSTEVTSVIELQSELCQVYRLPCHMNRLRGLLSLPESSRRFLSERVKYVNALHLHSVFRPENHWAARLGVPFVVSPHNGYNVELLKKRSRWKKWAARSLWERADVNRARAVFGLTGRECKDLRTYGIKTKTMPLPNILEPDVLAQAATSPPPGCLWVFIGRLDVEVKGLDVLLKGYALFRTSRRDRGSRLVIAGPDCRGGLEQLRRLAEQFGLSCCVDFPGPKFDAEKLELLSRTAVFLHPSRVEGLPYAVLEALAYGRPVMVTPTTNLAELVIKHGAGWVVDRTPESIAQVFHKIAAATPEELQSRGENARALIRTEFDCEPIARRLVSVYREIVA